MIKKYYIKERHNPQLAKPYYTGMGQLTKKDADEWERFSVYGSNNMLSFDSEKGYLEMLDTLKSDGFRVNVKSSS